MKYFVTSDIHSYYDVFLKALNEQGFEVFNPNHTIIVCGDIFDRGPDSIKIMHFLIDLQKQNRVLLIRGNHEDLLMNCLRSGSYTSSDHSNGTIDTIIQFCEYILGKKILYEDFKNNFKQMCKLVLNNNEIIDFIESMLDYYELDSYIFVHGFIPIDYSYSYPIYSSNWREANKFKWEKARWLNGMDMNLCNIIEENKIIVVGHYHTSYGNVRKEHNFKISEIDAKSLEYSDRNLFKPYYNNGIIALDSCCTFTGFLNCIVIEIK